jgi:hypothetical protein
MGRQTWFLWQHATLDPTGRAPLRPSIPSFLISNTPHTYIHTPLTHTLTYLPPQEAFLTARGAFASSLAAFSVCSYIAGVGDRHTENYMVSRSGAVIGIDFGFAFGVGASALPVPELVPFRLTRQLVKCVWYNTWMGVLCACARVCVCMCVYICV